MQIIDGKQVASQVLAWLCLGEALSWTLAAGAALVIGGIILVSTEEAHE